MKTGNFWWLAAVVACHEGRRVAGRTRLQKTMKLLQRLGLPTDYLYTIFFHGPHSEGVLHDLRVLAELGLVLEEVRLSQDAGTSYYLLEARPEAELGGMERFRQSIRKMEKTDLVILELAATYDTFREMGSNHLAALIRMRHKKATKWTPERETGALELLHHLGLKAG